MQKKLMKMIWNARYRSKKNNIPFDLSIKDLPPPPEYCPITLKKLNYNSKKITPESPSLERITPDLGYTKGNVAIISMEAQWIKSNHSLEKLEFVLNNFKKLKEDLKK